MFRIRLKELRENKGMSQYAFAAKFGVAQSTVGNWESGIREPNLDTIQRISEFFNVTVDYLLGADSNQANEDIKKSPSLEELLENDKELRVIYNLYSALDNEGKKQADDYLEFLLAKQEAEKEKK